MKDDKPLEVNEETIQIIGAQGNATLRAIEGDVLPVLTSRQLFILPGVVLPFIIGRPKSMRLINEALQNHQEILVNVQLQAETDDPYFNDITKVGCIAEVIKTIKLSDNTMAAILQGKCRAEITEQISELPYLKAKVHLLDDEIVDKTDSSFEKLTVLANNAKRRFQKINEENGEGEMLHGIAINEINDPVMLVNIMSCNIKADFAVKSELLLTGSVYERLKLLLKIIRGKEEQKAILDKVRNEVRGDMDRNQRDFIIRESIRKLQGELSENSPEDAGMVNPDFEDIMNRARTKNWDRSTAEYFDKEFAKLQHMNPSSPDYQVQYAFLKTLLDIPWNEFSTDRLNLERAEKILNRNHYGMEKVKERVLEYLAVLKLKGNLKSPILCLYGPPGVGKTSLGKSIAESLGRKYARMSLGGVHDEAEIRGHRKTYIGAMPGRIIANIIKCGTSNPVFVLDEVDKLSKDIHGDPSSALLEVLDPEQNSTFHDNYIDTDFDLSNVLFIATANDISNVPRPLLDRMELIEISGYVPDEKFHIATKHIIPQQLEKHGIDKKSLKIDKEALRSIIDNYTRESGVRALDKQIAKLMRRAAKTLVDHPDDPIVVKKADLKEYLGISHIDHDEYDIAGYTGVVTGLAWTQVGGEILFIETALNRSKEAKLSLTGSLGDVMKESAQLALEYIKAHTEELGIEQSVLDEHGIHLHVPEGATPKDGPSAGITILTAMVSSLTGRKVKNHIAMSGEITLRGKVLPVGGIKEKVLAAKRAGIKEIILCEENRKDVDEINEKYLEGVKFHFVKNMQEALAIALCPKE